MKIEIPDCLPEKILVTGGAGFIGSHLVESLLYSGRYVTVLDNMSNGNEQWLNSVKGLKNFKFVCAELTDFAQVQATMRTQEQVWHFAGNADIPLGYTNTLIDIDSAVYGTRNVLQAMVSEGVKDIIFASSGSVYGSLAETKYVTEKSGSLYPLSMYAAGKIAAESFISSFANLFGIRGWIFRFGNVLGTRMSRGAIKDFALRLNKNSERLKILGDGKQAKSYFLVEDCLTGMMWLLANFVMHKERSVEIFNLGNAGVTSVLTIAKYVAQAMKIPNLEFYFTGGSLGWPGDQPIVQLDVSKVTRLGWSPQYDSDTAVRIASERMIQYLGLGEEEK